MHKKILFVTLGIMWNLHSSETLSTPDIKARLQAAKDHLRQVHQTQRFITPEELAALNSEINGIFVDIPTSPDKKTRAALVTQATKVNCKLTALLKAQTPTITVSEE